MKIIELRYGTIEAGMAAITASPVPRWVGLLVVVLAEAQWHCAL